MLGKMIDVQQSFFFNLQVVTSFLLVFFPLVILPNFE